MRDYQVTIACTYKVNITAKNIKDAKEMVEFFTGDTKDCSNVAERKKYKFKIREIELVENEALEVETI
jgi:hypothetical protein